MEHNVNLSLINLERQLTLYRDDPFDTSNGAIQRPENSTPFFGDALLLVPNVMLHSYQYQLRQCDAMLFGVC